MKRYTALADIKADVNSGELKIVDLAQYYLSRIREYQNLNAFLEVFEEEVLEKAHHLQSHWETEKNKPLSGMFIALKDMISYKDHSLSASSKALSGFKAIYNATVTERLIQAGAIIIGRLNCDEFAMGGSNETSFYGPVKNFDDETRVSGGSSGGSSVAVQADLCLASLGTDTGGSIRQPSSFCGVYGLKPTYGRVSRYGVVAFASSFDQVGPITQSLSDSALILEVIAGQDPHDATTSKEPIPNFYSGRGERSPKKIAYLKETLNSPGLDPEVKEGIHSLIKNLKKQGHKIEPVSFPLLEYVVPTYYILTTAEASSNLSRYDGVHFGYRSPLAHDLESTYKLSRSEGFGKEVKRRIMLGTFVLSAGYYDAYYSKAQKVRRMIQDETLKILKDYDFILTPTTPSGPFKIGEKISDPIVMYLEDIFTVQANLTGLPAISLPLFRNSQGLAYGTQIMAGPFQESLLFSFSDYLMDEFHLQKIK